MSLNEKAVMGVVVILLAGVTATLAAMARYTLYPVALVAPVHARLIWDALAVLALKPVGAAGTATAGAGVVPATSAEPMLSPAELTAVTL